MAEQEAYHSTQPKTKMVSCIPVASAVSLALLAFGCQYGYMLRSEISLQHHAQPYFMNLLLRWSNKVQQVEETQGSSTSYQCQSRLNWHLQGVDSANESTLSPFVTFDDILPVPLLNKVVDEVQAGINTQTGQCTLRRDGLTCQSERWVPLTLSELKASSIQGRDVFEQAIIEASKYDLDVLPSHIASQITGVSWRILQGESGNNVQLFHYDCDEPLDEVFGDASMPSAVSPLLSSLTFLTDHGEPNVILEHAQIQSTFQRITTNETQDNTTIYQDRQLYPCNAFVSMPKANKHVAFDSRLYHGSSAPIPKNPTERRIAIGLHFYTSKPMESVLEDSSDELQQDHIIEPMEIPSDEFQNGRIRPWSPDDIISLDERDTSVLWQAFQLITFKHGFDYCRNLAPCEITMHLPTFDLLMNELHDEKAGATVGFQLGHGDFLVKPLINADAEKVVQSFQDDIDEFIASKDNLVGKKIAMEVLQKRCSMYDNDLLSFNPPMFHHMCKQDTDA